VWPLKRLALTASARAGVPILWSGWESLRRGQTREMDFRQKNSGASLVLCLRRPSRLENKRKGQEESKIEKGRGDRLKLKEPTGQGLLPLT
jgi:hypothetical protein